MFLIVVRSVRKNLFNIKLSIIFISIPNIHLNFKIFSILLALSFMCRFVVVVSFLLSLFSNVFIHLPSVEFRFDFIRFYFVGGAFIMINRSLNILCWINSLEFILMGFAFNTWRLLLFCSMSHVIKVKLFLPSENWLHSMAGSMWPLTKKNPIDKSTAFEKWTIDDF